MDAASFLDLGISGFSLLVMWWMYESNRKERKEHFDFFVVSLTEREVAFRQLEREVREKMLAQLHENTQVYKRVLDHFNA